MAGMEKADLNLAIDKALENGEIKVFYQPKVEAGSTRVVGAEALVRWQKPDGSYIYPDEFIPELERTGKIVKLDYFVYQKVFGSLSKRIEQGKPVVPVSVNVSRIHLKNLDIYKYLKSLFRMYRVPPRYIELELTESVYAEVLEIFKPYINHFRSIGGKVSMDDFGSGYSSLNLLTDLPVDTLKVDKVFLKHSELKENEKIILSCVIKMAKKLKLDVLCEGVETISQSQFLSKMGCDMFQGYLYSKALPETEFCEYMEQHMNTEINEIHFSFQDNLWDDTGTYEGICHGDKITFADGPIKGMRALHFSGGEPYQDCVELPVSVLTNDSFTISFWMKEEQSHLWSSIYYAGYENGFCDIMPKAWDMKLSFRMKDGEDPAGWNDVGTEVVSLNKWVMVTASYNSSNHISKIYIDGRRCGILEDVLNLVGPRAIYLGCDIYAKGYYGYLADLHIFDQEISFEAVKEMYKKVKKHMHNEVHEEEEREFEEIHFALQGDLKDVSGTYECQFVGKDAVFADGPKSGMGALYFPGGAIGENILALPKEMNEEQSATVSFWIKDENPRQWVSSFFVRTKYGFMAEIPKDPENNTILRIKDEREEDWKDSVRKSLMKKGQWHNVVIVYNQKINMAAHYIDGHHNGITNTCRNMGEIEKIWFGGDDFQNSFEGYISDIRFFNRTFDIEQIRQLYEGTLDV